LIYHFLILTSGAQIIPSTTTDIATTILPAPTDTTVSPSNVENRNGDIPTVDDATSQARPARQLVHSPSAGDIIAAAATYNTPYIVSTPTRAPSSASKSSYAPSSRPQHQVTATSASQRPDPDTQSQSHTQEERYQPSRPAPHPAALTPPSTSVSAFSSPVRPSNSSARSPVMNSSYSSQSSVLEPPKRPAPPALSNSLRDISALVEDRSQQPTLASFLPETNTRNSIPASTSASTFTTSGTTTTLYDDSVRYRAGLAGGENARTTDSLGEDILSTPADSGRGGERGEKEGKNTIKGVFGSFLGGMSGEFNDGSAHRSC
jgi:hypothetical protein